MNAEQEEKGETNCSGGGSLEMQAYQNTTVSETLARKGPILYYPVKVERNLIYLAVYISLLTSFWYFSSVNLSMRLFL